MYRNNNSNHCNDYDDSGEEMLKILQHETDFALQI